MGEKGAVPVRPSVSRYRKSSWRALPSGPSRRDGVALDVRIECNRHVAGIRSPAVGGDTVDGASVRAAGVPGPSRTQRRWSSGEKARIVAESHEPGTVVVAVAARHGIST